MNARITRRKQIEDKEENESERRRQSEDIEE
jgi:hypothetical protein